MFSLMPRRRERRAERALVPWEHTPFDLLRQEFASLFDRFFGKPPWEMTEPWGVETEEKEAEVVVRAEMPGFEASEVEVLLTGNELTIKAMHKEEKKEGKEVCHVQPHAV
jgi:HSP20 family protein